MNSTKSDLTTEETVESVDLKTSIKETVRSLKFLLEGDEQEQRETFEYLKQALNGDRPSNRRLFQ